MVLFKSENKNQSIFITQRYQDIKIFYIWTRRKDRSSTLFMYDCKNEEIYQTRSVISDRNNYLFR